MHSKLSESALAGGNIGRIVEWTPEFAVNVPEIDHEHQRWFDLIDDLHTAMLAGKGKLILADALDRAIRYGEEHLVHEEQLMQRTGFPQFASHAAQHEGLRRTVESLAERLETGEATMTIEVMQLLWDWLKQHITTSDRRIGEYLAETGQTGFERTKTVR